MRIARDQIIEVEAHRFMADASDLGLRVGEWPASFETDAGNGQPFVRQGPKYHEGELIGYSYRQSLGCISLTIQND